MKIRKAQFFGKFYPSVSTEIENLLRKILQKEKNNISYNLANRNIIGGVVPHAGYIYSGYQAIHFFEIVKTAGAQYDTVVIINPNHTGLGPAYSVDNSDVWATPMGETLIDKELLNELNLPISNQAHAYEHSGEVMVPFIQHYFDNSIKILPICIHHQSYENAYLIAQALFVAKRKLNRKILIIASSDFSHQVPPEYGFKMDQLVIDAILEMNSEKVEQNVLKHDISVCGYAPIMSLIEYCKLEEGLIRSTVLSRGNSGEVFQSSRVVDYVSILFHD